MSGFYWNIPNWIKTILPPHLIKPKMEAWLNALLAPIETTKAKYLTETAVNGQTMVLQAFLNDIFDPTQRRIYITTFTDILPNNYTYLLGENQFPIYLYTKTENIQETWIYKTLQYGDRGGFKVMVPNDLNTQINSILLYTNKYKLAGKTAIIETY